MTRTLLAALIVCLSAGCRERTLRPFSALPLHTPSILEFNQHIQVNNGLKVNKNLFPASFWTYNANSYCSATFVGANTMLMAGHCVSDGEVVEVTDNITTIDATCHRHPGYDLDTYQRDVAVCVLAKDWTTLPYERVDVTTVPAKDTVVMMAGFGCDGKKTSKTFRVGFATIDAPPTANEDHLIASGVRSVVDKNGVLVDQRNGKPAQLCEGDSGGATYAFSTPLATTRRTVVGINSAVGSDGRSQMASLGVAEIKQFLETWAANGAKICGITAQASNCR